MPSRGKDYGNASQVTTHVDSYADGGMVKPKKGRKPKRITTKNPPGGPHTPGAKKKKAMGYADGGEAKKKSKKPAKKPSPKILPPGSARKAGEQLKGRQAQLDQQMKDLGI